MSFKFPGVIMILASGAFATLEVKKRYDKRVENINMFLCDFDFFINHISFFKTSISEMLKLIIIKKEKEFKEFYTYIEACYNPESTNKLSDAFFVNDFYLNLNDREAILNFFKNLGDKDYENQLNSLKFQRETLNNILNEAKENKLKNQKSKCTITMCLFFMVIIFFI